MGALWSAAGRPAAPLHMRTFSTSARAGVVKSQRSFLSALARTPGAVMDGPRLALSGVTRFRAVRIENRANPCRQISLTVPRGTFLVPTPLDGVHRHGKSFALQRWRNRGTPRPFGQLFAHRNILARPRAAFNTRLDGPNFDAQSIRIEFRRGRDATAMRGLTRISPPLAAPTGTDAGSRALTAGTVDSRAVHPRSPFARPTRVAAGHEVRRLDAV